MTVLVLVGGLLVASVMLAAFIELERRGRPEVALAVLLGLVLLEALLYQSEHLVPEGIFRLSVAGLSVRLPEVVIVLALMGRAVVHGLPQRVSAVGAAWSIFLGWYALQGVLGVLLGNPFGDVIYQLRAVVYIGGAFALTSFVPTGRFVSARFLGRTALVVGMVVLVFIPLSLSDTSLSADVPGVPLTSLGEIAADSASIFVVAAVVIVLVELGRRRPRSWVLLATVPLVVAPFATTQRGAVVGLGASVVTITLAACGRTWHRRRIATASQMAVCALLLVAVAVVSFLPASTGAQSTAPITAFYEETFEATAKQQSADTRRLLWDEGHRLWKERPLLGSGLGTPFEVRRIGSRDGLVAGGFHNLAYDLLVRSGAVGLVLFVIAIVLSFREGMRGWWFHVDRRIAALALAAMAAVTGLLAKGMVESVLEKAKLSTLVGVLLAVMVSAGRSARERGDSEDDAVSIGAGREPSSVHQPGSWRP